jgi:hypothetical protein
MRVEGHILKILGLTYQSHFSGTWNGFGKHKCVYLYSDYNLRQEQLCEDIVLDERLYFSFSLLSSPKPLSHTLTLHFLSHSFLSSSLLVTLDLKIHRICSLFVCLSYFCFWDNVLLYILRLASNSKSSYPSVPDSGITSMCYFEWLYICDFFLGG